MIWKQIDGNAIYFSWIETEYLEKINMIFFSLSYTFFLLVLTGNLEKYLSIMWVMDSSVCGGLTSGKRNSEKK